LIGSIIINPLGISPDIDGKYYSHDITKNVPTFTLILIGILVVCGTLGVIFVIPFKNEQNEGYNFNQFNHLLV